MYDNLSNTIKTINKSKKIRCFFLGNTVKRESSSEVSSYVTVKKTKESGYKSSNNIYTYAYRFK